MPRGRHEGLDLPERLDEQIGLRNPETSAGVDRQVQLLAVKSHVVYHDDNEDSRKRLSHSDIAGQHSSPKE